MEEIRKLAALLALLAMVLIGCGGGGDNLDATGLVPIPNSGSSGGDDSDGTSGSGGDDSGRSDDRNTAGDDTGSGGTNPGDDNGSGGDGSNDPSTDPGDGGTTDPGDGGAVIPPPSDPAGLLAGPYTVMGYKLSNLSASSSMATVNFGGDGTYEVNKLKTVWGTGVNRPYPASGTYSVSTDGSAFSFSSLAGAVSATGDFFVFANLGKPDELAIGVGVKTGSQGFSNDSLTGDYWLTAMNTMPDLTRTTSYFAGKNFKSGQFRVNGWKSDSSGPRQPYANQGDYSIAEDGSLSFSTYEAETVRPFSGAVFRQGEMFMYTNVSHLNIKEYDQQDIGIGFRTPGPQARNSLSGKYDLVDLSFSGSGWRSCSLAQMIFREDHTYSYTEIYNQSGGLFAGPNQAHAGGGTYSFLEDGTLLLVENDQPTLNLAVTASGDLFIFSMISHAGEQRLGIGIRRE